jgi:hypothetical protein
VGAHLDGADERRHERADAVGVLEAPALAALRDARGAVARAAGPELVVLAADAERTLAEVLRAAGRDGEAAAAAGRALALDAAKGNLAAAAATRERFGALPLPVT